MVTLLFIMTFTGTANPFASSVADKVSRNEEIYLKLIPDKLLVISSKLPAFCQQLRDFL